MEKDLAKVAERYARTSDTFYIKMPSEPVLHSAEAMRREQELLDHLRRRGPAQQTLKPLAIFYSRTGQQETAYRYLKSWMQHARDTEEIAECLLMCGQVAEQVDQPKSAVAFYTEALELKPKHPSVSYGLHNNLSFCLNLLAEHQRAAEHAQTAIDLDPTRSNAFKNLAMSLSGLGRYADAAKILIKALHVDASDPRPLKLLEALMEQYGEPLRQGIPDLEPKLAACRQAVMNASSGRFADWAKALTLN